MMETYISMYKMMAALAGGDVKEGAVLLRISWVIRFLIIEPP